MYQLLNEVPLYNLGSYLLFLINESKQYDLFESIDGGYDIKKEWEDIKLILTDFAKKGLINVGTGIANISAATYNGTKGTVGIGINAVNKKPVNKNINSIKLGANQAVKGVSNTVKGAANITVDIFKLLGKLSKGIIAAITYLTKKMTSAEAKAAMIKILLTFKSLISVVIKKLKLLTARLVIILFIGTSTIGGVVYTMPKIDEYIKEYKEMVAQQQDIENLALHGIVNNQAVGVDISYCQDYMSDKDWQMIEDKCQFVIIRCGAGFNGPKQDKEYITHYKNAKAHNLKVGIYYFFTDHRDPQALFNMLRQTMDAVGGKDLLDIKPIIDLEDQSLVNKDVKQYLKNVREFIDLYVQTYKEPPIIYCGAKHISDHGLDFLMTEYHCVFWTAHYGRDGKGTIYKEAETINDKKDIFMNTNFSIKDSTVMLQYSETGDLDLTLKRGLDVDVCWNWNAIRNK